MSIDFPRAWQLCKAAPDEKHDPKCSWIVQRLLCDCHVIKKHHEYLDDILQGENGMPCKKQYHIKEEHDHAFLLFEKLKDFYAQPLDGCWPLRPHWVPDMEKPPKHVKSRHLSQSLVFTVTKFRRFTFEEFIQILEIKRQRNIERFMNHGSLPVSDYRDEEDQPYSKAHDSEWHSKIRCAY